jgi:hypothetical protein
MLINSYGWRITNMLLALFVFTVAVPTAIFMRHTPEQIGLRPDGDARTPRARDQSEEKSLLQRKKGTSSSSSSSSSSSGKNPPGGSEEENDDDEEEGEETFEDEEDEEEKAYSFTRQEALRTAPVYILGVDIFFSAVIGAGTIQVLKQVRSVPCSS